LRIWTLHPKYLDAKGLVALWRESLLARHVLLGKTRGYRNHPQLIRFRQNENPVNCIDLYLSAVFREALVRGYHFNKEKLNRELTPAKIKVTSGQVHYEVKHLMNKLRKRDKEKFKQLSGVKLFKVHPLFKVTSGNIESWEVV